MQARNIFQTVWALVPLLILIGGVTSCERVPPYEAILRNVGSEEVDKTTVYFDGQIIPGGILIVGSMKNARVSYPIPEFAEVEWQTLDGVMHREKVAVKKLLPSRKPEEVYLIYFNISGNDVNVSVETYRYPVLGVDYHVKKTQ